MKKVTTFLKILQKETLYTIILGLLICGFIHAQETQKKMQLNLQAGLGVGSTGVKFDSEKNSRIGIILHLRLEVQNFGIDWDFHPFKVKNDTKDEAVRSLYTLASYRFGKKFYVQPGLGFSTQWWSGKDVSEKSTFTPAVGLSFGYRQLKIKSFHFIPELMWRYSIDNKRKSTLFGIQLTPCW